jgi:hypothetical protein
MFMVWREKMRRKMETGLEAAPWEGEPGGWGLGALEAMSISIQYLWAARAGKRNCERGWRNQISYSEWEERDWMASVR